MTGEAQSYKRTYDAWRTDPEGFWAEAARAIDWFVPPTRIFDADAGVYGRWFPDAVCNTCHNAIDRHVARGRGEHPFVQETSEALRGSLSPGK